MAQMHTTWESAEPFAPGAWIITHTDAYGNKHEVWLTKEDAQALARDILDHK